MVCCPEASAKQPKGIKSACTSHSTVNLAELVHAFMPDLD